MFSLIWQKAYIFFKLCFIIYYSYNNRIAYAYFLETIFTIFLKLFDKQIRNNMGEGSATSYFSVVLAPGGTWSRSDEMQCGRARRTLDSRFLSPFTGALNSFHIIIGDRGSCAPPSTSIFDDRQGNDNDDRGHDDVLPGRGVQPPHDVLLCKFNDVADAMLVLSHGRVGPPGGEFVPRYLKVSTRGTPDKPRDIWKCQSDKYGSCVVVMQPAPSRC